MQQGNSMNLQKADLNFGFSSCQVVATEGVPLPQTFDLDNPEACARRVFEVMSKASGGHRLKACVLSLNREIGMASLNCKGAKVLYGQPSKDMSAEQVIELLRKTERFFLGDVTADRSGVRWSPESSVLFKA